MSADWVSGIVQDFTFAARVLAKDRRFTVAAVVALALAIGVNNSVFALINAALIRDLPFEQADRLVAISVPNPHGPSGMSYPDFRDLRAATSAFEGLAAIANSPMNVSEPDLAPERFRGTAVSANTFRLLRSAPMLGRDFLPEDDRPGAPGVVMLGHAIWQTRYGGDASVVGRTVRVNDVPATVIGVMPPGFTYPMIAQIWQPLALAGGVADARRDSRNLQVFGRLADGADFARGRAELETAAAQLEREYPDTNKDKRLAVVPMRDAYGGITTSMLMTFLGAVALVLLVACANLANLLMARSAGRAREIAIRLSLGATRWRVVRQLLIECLLIAALASIVGSVLSIYGARAIAVGFDVIEAGAPSASTRPFWVDLSMNGVTYLFLGLLCVFATFACGLVPALYISRISPNDTLKEGGRGSAGGAPVRRWTSAFVVAELALTLVLLAGAGLLWRGFLTRYNTDVVIDPSNLVTMRLALPVQKYPTPEERKRFVDRLDERMASMSAVSSASVASAPPFDFGVAGRRVAFDGRPAEPGQTLPSVSYIQTGARYFETVRLPMLRGRVFTVEDGAVGQEGAIVDQRFATTFFPEGSPIGRRIRLTVENAPDGWAPWLTVVGVAPTLPPSGPPQFVRPVVYVPLRADPALEGFAALLVRGGPGLAAVTSALRDEVRRLDPDLPLYAIETMDTIVARQRYGVRLIGTWFGIIAAIALVLAAVGLYALTAHGVAQRTQEIGVRIALGAQRPQALWLFMRRAVVQLGVGLSLGLAGTLATGRLLETFLEGVSPRDPVTLLAVAALLIVVAAAAGVVPARRATRVDPVVALRSVP